MKLALAAIQFDSMSLDDVFALAATSGYDGVELSARSPSLGVDSASTQARAIKKSLDEHGLRCPCLSTAIGGYSRLDDAASARQLELLMRYAELGRELVAPLVRQLDGGPSSAEATEDDWLRAASWLQRGADLLRQTGLGVVVETLPRSLCDSVDGACRLTRMVDRENFGILLDPANLFVMGRMPSFDSVVRLGSRIKHVHVKDLERVARDGDDGATTPEYRVALLGEGEVDLRPVIEGLVAAGYEGFLTVDQGAVADAELEVRHNAAAVAVLVQSITARRAHPEGAA